MFCTINENDLIASNFKLSKIKTKLKEKKIEVQNRYFSAKWEIKKII